MQNLYITLGINGRVSKSLNKYFNQKGEYILSFSWENIKEFLYEKEHNSQKKLFFLEKIKNFKKEFQEIIFIDCLIGTTSIQKERDLHTKIIKKIKNTFINSKYIFLSTYEADIISGTSYRRMKVVLEKSMMLEGSIIIRLGCLVDNNIDSASCTNILVDELFRKIRVPITKIKDLFKSIKDSTTKKGLIRCYSDYMVFSVFSILPLKIKIVPTNNEKFNLPVPFIIGSKLLKLFTYFLRVLKCNRRILDLLEKPYSLLVHQKIIKQLYDA